MEPIDFHKQLDLQGLTEANILLFRSIIYGYYREHGRIFPWRQTNDPYHILVSEIMLQQTQTSRVAEKYPLFIAQFPDLTSLAAAPLEEILRAWQGLGYNRRALALQKTARAILDSSGGILPSSPEMLISLPGIGKYTASAIAAFAFNRPAVFIETNIRTVFIYFFFRNRTSISDKEIQPLVETTLDRADPRRWYYALFDYGVMLKKTENQAGKSSHYRKQSPFKGSNREVRSRIVKLLLQNSPLSEAEIVKLLKIEQQRITQNLYQLQKEGLVTVREDNRGYCIR